MNSLPLQVVIDEVHPNNKWELILIKNDLFSKFIIKKGVYYYNIVDITPFKNIRYSIHLNEELNSICLGEYRPLLADNGFISILPIVLNGNEYVINIRTKIIYIRPKNITYLFSKYTSYNTEIFNECYYGGIYKPYLNAENHTGQLFIQMIPNSQKYSQPISNMNHTPNNIQNKYVSVHQYDKMQSSKSLLGDKMLNQNEYNGMNNPQLFNVKTIEDIHRVDSITFIVPFLEKHTNNKGMLEKTLWSIVNNVQKKMIIVVTNKEHFELNPELMKYVSIYQYGFYVGKLGYENRLNVLMKNGFDIASFYNTIINQTVKTDSYIIWNYNWLLVNQWNISETNLCIPIYNYYLFNGNEYQSKNYTFGVLLDNKKRYSSTSDFMNIYVPNIKQTLINIKAPIKCLYSEEDYLEVKSAMVYENNKELKNFYESILNNTIPDYILAKLE